MGQEQKNRIIWLARAIVGGAFAVVSWWLLENVVVKNKEQDKTDAILLEFKAKYEERELWQQRQIDSNTEAIRELRKR